MNEKLRYQLNFGSIRCAIVALALSMAVGFTVKACSSPELVETFGEKSEWSVLQSIESQTRDIPLTDSVVRKIFDHEVLGVTGASGGNIWILLKTESPPFYKQMPAGQYNLPLNLVEQLERGHRLSYTVGAVLRSHVQKESNSK